MLMQVFVNWESPKNRGNSGQFSEKSKCLKRKEKKKNLHFASALFSKDMLRIVKGFAPWILFEMFEGKVSISIGVPGDPLRFMRLIRVGILHVIYYMHFICIYLSYTFLFHIMYCSYTFHVLYFSYIVILYFTSCSYNCLYFHRIAVLCFSYHVIYSIHVISFLGFMSAYTLEADTGNNCMYL